MRTSHTGHKRGFSRGSRLQRGSLYSRPIMRKPEERQKRTRSRRRPSTVIEFRGLELTNSVASRNRVAHESCSGRPEARRNSCSFGAQRQAHDAAVQIIVIKESRRAPLEIKSTRVSRTIRQGCRGWSMTMCLDQIAGLKSPATFECGLTTGRTGGRTITADVEPAFEGLV